MVSESYSQIRSRHLRLLATQKKIMHRIIPVRLSLGAVHDAMGEDAIIEGSGLSRLKVASEELADQHKKKHPTIC